MMNTTNNRSYDRHELCISSKMDIGGYLGYARVQLIDEKKPFVVIKARGNAIENALKVAAMAKQTIAGVLSCTKICLQFTVEKQPSTESSSSPVKRSREKLIEEIDMYETLKKDYRTQSRIIPAIEIILYTDEGIYNLKNEPGFQEASSPRALRKIFRGFNKRQHQYNKNE